MYSTRDLRLSKSTSFMMMMGCLSFRKEDLNSCRKYGEHAERMTLCALRNWPSAERVTSTNDSSSKRVSITEMIVVRWLFLEEKINLDDSTSVTITSRPTKASSW